MNNHVQRRNEMGITYTFVEIANPADTKIKIKEEFLVDSGALYSVVPKNILQRLRIKPHRKETFILANGETIKRDIGDATFIFMGRRASSPVIFGNKGDQTLLGTVTLEALGLFLDPLRRELKPMPMVL